MQKVACPADTCFLDAVFLGRAWRTREGGGAGVLKPPQYPRCLCLLSDPFQELQTIPKGLSTRSLFPGMGSNEQTKKAENLSLQLLDLSGMRVTHRRYGILHVKVFLALTSEHIGLIPGGGGRGGVYLSYPVRWVDVLGAEEGLPWCRCPGKARPASPTCPPSPSQGIIHTALTGAP